MKKTQFFSSLESMRGLAALIVVLMHMPPIIPNRYIIGLVHNGFLMVPFFFVLSGFVIHYNYFDFLQKRNRFWTFMFLRFGRLYPVHIVFLMLWLLLEIARYVAANHYGIHAPVTKPFQKNSPLAFVENLLLIQSLGISADNATFNTPSWSISVEFYTYAVFALAALYARRWFPGLALLAACAGFASLSMLLLGRFDPVVSCLTGFFLGTLVSILARNSLAPSWVANLAFIAFFGFLAIWPLGSFAVAIYPLSGLLVFSLLGEGSLVERVLSLRPIQWLGKISYSLYMSHMFVLWVSGVVIARIAGENLSAPASVRFGNLSTAAGFIAYFAILIAVMVMAAATHRFVEAPCRTFSRRIARQYASALFAAPV